MLFQLHWEGLGAPPSLELKLKDQSVGEDKLHEAEQTIVKMGGQESVEKRLEIVYGASVLEKVFSLCDVFFGSYFHSNEMAKMGNAIEMISDAGIKLFRLILDGISPHTERKQGNSTTDEIKSEQHSTNVRNLIIHLIPSNGDS